MSSLPRILVYGGPGDRANSLTKALKETFSPIRAESIDQALQLLGNGEFAGICLLEGEKVSLSGAALFPQMGGVLSSLPDGLAIIDIQLKIVWTNQRFEELSGAKRNLVGCLFYDAFGAPEILGPDLSPFHTALGSGEASHTTLRLSEKLYFDVHAAPMTSPDAVAPQFLVVSVRDVSAEILQQQKLNAIFKAGLELGDLTPEELMQMSSDDRIELIKARIVQNTKDLLEYETVEIRLLDPATKRLTPLLNFGMVPEAANRELYARQTGNGVTGFVAATGKSYLCPDTADDPLYIVGAEGARSSLTVPLMLHDQIRGTFNVESKRPGAFSANDLEFLELFSREVAAALNTLDLLVAEKLTTAAENKENILREVAQPADAILNDATWILDSMIGLDPNVSSRLLKILEHTREIRQKIHSVSEAVIPQGTAAAAQRVLRPKFRGKRVLVVDNDEAVHRAAHDLLGKHGCQVESAHDGQEALRMARQCSYDIVLVDIRLPDLNGYDCFCELRGINESTQVVLMTGFGYDAGHSIVKCRQRGLKSVLYKPFRVDMMLDELEKNLFPHGAAIVNQGETAGTTVVPSNIPPAACP